MARKQARNNTSIAVIEDDFPAVQQAVGTVQAIPWTVAMLKPARELARSLSESTPRDFIKQKPGGDYDYVPWSYVARRLNAVLGPTWSLNIESKDIFGLDPLPGKAHDNRCGGESRCRLREHQAREQFEVVVHVRLTTPFGSQDAWGDHKYFPANADGGYGRALQSATQTGLKRAAARLGIALDLYDDLEDPDSFDQAMETAEARGRFKAFLEGEGLTQKQAVDLLSQRIAGEAGALLTLEDCVAAAGYEGAAAYDALMDILRSVDSEVVEGEVV